MPLSSFVGLLGCALLPIGVCLVVCRVRHYSATVRTITFFAACGVMLIPINNLTVAGYIRGAIGDVSITTIILLCGICSAQIFRRDIYQPAGLSIVLLVVLLAGLILYPTALGLSEFDAYVSGYGSVISLAVLFLVTLAAWWFNSYLLFICILAGIVAYILGILESRNIYDYLIDPLLVVYALLWWVIKAIRYRCQ